MTSNVKWTALTPYIPRGRRLFWNGRCWLCPDLVWFCAEWHAVWAAYTVYKRGVWPEWAAKTPYMLAPCRSFGSECLRKRLLARWFAVIYCIYSQLFCVG